MGGDAPLFLPPIPGDGGGAGVGAAAAPGDGGWPGCCPGPRSVCLSVPAGGWPGAKARPACGHGVCLGARGSTWKCRAGGGFRPVKHSKVGQEHCKWVLFVHLLLVRTGKCAAAPKSFLWRR